MNRKIGFKSKKKLWKILLVRFLVLSNFIIFGLVGAFCVFVLYGIILIIIYEFRETWRQNLRGWE